MLCSLQSAFKSSFAILRALNRGKWGHEGVWLEVLEKVVRFVILSSLAPEPRGAFRCKIRQSCAR